MQSQTFFDPSTDHTSRSPGASVFLLQFESCRSSTWRLSTLPSRSLFLIACTSLATKPSLAMAPSRLSLFVQNTDARRHRNILAGNQQRLVSPCIMVEVLLRLAPCTPHCRLGEVHQKLRYACGRRSWPSSAVCLRALRLQRYPWISRTAAPVRTLATISPSALEMAWSPVSCSRSSFFLLRFPFDS